jgi:hypothetical protein
MELNNESSYQKIEIINELIDFQIGETEDKNFMID